MMTCVFEQSPVLLQKMISKDADLRIVVTPKEIFAFKIQSDRLDWRSSVLESQISQIKLDRSFQKKIRQLAKSVGLEQTCVDAVMKGREIYFLEINRPGAWFFLEALTGTPITKSLAQSLSV